MGPPENDHETTNTSCTTIMRTGIALRRVALSPDECAAAIAAVDMARVPPDTADLLAAEFILADDDLAKIRARAAAGEKLADVDEFVLRVRLRS